MRLFLLLLLLSTSPELFAQDSPPRSLDDRLEITLFAEDPLLNTPTGIDVDHKGRVWVIESNTHFPPEGYDGHPTDRLLILKDTNGDGKAEAKTFIDGFTHSMSVAVRPVWLDAVSFDENDKPEDLKKRRQVFFATRREILLLEDTDGDDQCDKQTSLVHLDTEGNYPHNGLAGFAFDALGNMYFGFGENLGADYKIIGRDGTTYSGGGEGGNIYQVQPDGTKLKHWATGFWNPHASCVDAFGRLFSVDNDPDSLPPCRLLHIIEGGDYGYRYRNGRKGFHPFTCWNGEIPGTLPMVAGTGEAPSGILAYEHDAFPEKYLGNLIVTSWGDHRIDRFRLKRKGASFESVAEPFIVGGENFRPVGIALAPDGSLYLSDWVLREYKLHGKGRVWRIKPKVTPQTAKGNEESLEDKLKSAYLPERRLAAKRLARQKDKTGKQTLLKVLGDDEASPRAQVEALWALAELPGDQLPANTFLPRRTQDGHIIGGRKIATRDFSVWLAAMRLMGTPHFPVPSHPTGTDGALGLFKDADLVVDVGEEQSDEDLLYSSFAVIYPMYRYLKSDLGPQRDNDQPPVDPKVELGNLLVKLTQYMMPLSNDAPFLRSICMRTVLQPSHEGTDLRFIQSEILNDYVQKVRDGKYVSPSTTGESFKPLVDEPLDAFIALYLRAAHPKDIKLAAKALEVDSPIFKFLAVQWIAEENLKDLRSQVETLFDDPNLSPDLFLATLAALEILDGKPPAEFDKTPPGKHVLPILKDDTKPANVRAIALRLVDPDDPELPPKLIQQLMDSDNPRLREEAIRTAAMTPRQQLTEPLLKLALDPQAEERLRAEATLGLARRMADNEKVLETIGQLSRSENHTIAREALRTLRKQSGQRLVEPFESAAEADPLAGRRLFFHPNGPGCYKCHTVHGRGGNIGPDLSTIGGALTRKKLIESIRKPSREVAPQFTTWTMISTSGKTYTGMIVHENKGDTVLGLKDGTTIQLKTADVEERAPQKTSVMPEKLEQQMTEREFEDLIAFLESLK
jgi:putative membrane-bound dehydrogenase-like protein